SAIGRALRIRPMVAASTAAGKVNPTTVDLKLNQGAACIHLIIIREGISQIAPPHRRRRPGVVAMQPSSSRGGVIGCGCPGGAREGRGPMAESRAIRSGWGLAIVALAVSSHGFGGDSRAQVASPPAGSPASDYSHIVDAVEPPSIVFGPTLGTGPASNSSLGAVPVAPRVEMGLFETITDSLFGDVYAEGRWRPISLSTFFSEGWLEPWASGPAGQSGLTPRHGWLGAFEGVFYRLWLTGPTYKHNLSTPVRGDGYSGNFVIFLPFSRR